ADSERSARDADLFYDLPVVEQPDSPLRGQVARTRQTWRISRLVVAHDHSRRTVSVRHWSRMAPADLRTWIDDFYESFWDYVLLACWPARVPRHGWSDHAVDRSHFRFGWPRRGRSVPPHRCACPVLALCRCCVGRGFHRSLHSGSLRKSNGKVDDSGTTRSN